MHGVAGHVEESDFYSKRNGNILTGFKQESDVIQLSFFKVCSLG